MLAKADSRTPKDGGEDEEDGRAASRSISFFGATGSRTCIFAGAHVAFLHVVQVLRRCERAGCRRACQASAP